MNGIELNVANPGNGLVEWINESISDYGVENKDRLRKLLQYTYGTTIDFSAQTPIVNVDKQFIFGGWDKYNVGGIGVDHGVFLAHVFVYCMMEDRGVNPDTDIIVKFKDEELGKWNPTKGFVPNPTSGLIENCVERDEQDIERTDCLSMLGD